VKAGKKIKINFSNPDFLPHNLLITRPKTADKVAAAAVAMGAEGFAKGFRPDTPDILAGSKMLDNGQKETIEFTLPDPGDYEIVCSFPGHHILMRATLRVR
jgi:azurin